MMWLALLAAQAAAPQPGELRLFRDWTVGCDNGRACEAIALLPEGEEWDQWTTLSLRRDAAAEARPVVMLPNIETAPAALLADGRALAVRFAGSIDGFAVEAADETALVAALRDARTLELRDAAGGTLARISPSGSAAAMLYMDEAQRRVGTVTALARAGTRPASAVPPPPRRAQVRLAPASDQAPITLSDEQVRALRRESGCTIDEVGGPDEHYAEALAPGQTLVLLTCGTGAYNLSLVPFIAERRGGRIDLRIAPFDSQWGIVAEGRPTLINGQWDAESRLLGEFSKGRGLGDCGRHATYGWDGASFRLVRQEDMDECRGSLDYVTTWEAEVVRP
jgi:hypothetical protein